MRVARKKGLIACVCIYEIGKEGIIPIPQTEGSTPYCTSRTLNLDLLGEKKMHLSRCCNAPHRSWSCQLPSAQCPVPSAQCAPAPREERSAVHCISICITWEAEAKKAYKRVCTYTHTWSVGGGGKKKQSKKEMATRFFRTNPDHSLTGDEMSERPA